MDLRNIVNNDEDSGSIFSPHSSPTREKQGSLASLLNAEITREFKERASKPRRYATVPIWAQTWNPKHKHNSTNKNSTPHTAPPGVSDPQLRNPGDAVGSARAPTGPGGYPSLLDLPASLTGVIPADDITTKICNWLYSHLFQLEGEREHIELEFKMGQILDYNTRQRARLPFITEAVISPDYAREKLTFDATIESSQFSRVEGFISGLAGRPGAATATKLPDTRHKDVMHPQQDTGANVRLTYDENDNLVGRLVKKRIGDLLIHCPGDLTDWRISLSTETPYTGSLEQLSRPVAVRNKNRQSWRTTGLQIDLTGVISEGTKSAKSKEVELEMDKDMLLKFFGDFQSKSDPQAMDKFQELMRYGMDSCRTISRFVSR